MTKILDVTKLEAFADDKVNVAKLAILVYERVENSEKGENARYQQYFSPFPRMFSKAFFIRFVKSRDCLVNTSNPLTLPKNKF